MRFINCTPHDINVNGDVYKASGHVARVSSTHDHVGDLNGIPTYTVSYGDVTGLPDNSDSDTIYIVSAMVLAAAPDRGDLAAPATGHPDVVRNQAGHVQSVPGLVFNK